MRAWLRRPFGSLGSYSKLVAHTRSTIVFLLPMVAFLCRCGLKRITHARSTAINKLLVFAISALETDSTRIFLPVYTFYGLFIHFRLPLVA